jgi:hypothetical protein
VKGEELILAHSLGSSGPEIELLLVAGAILLLGLTLYRQKSVRPYVGVLILAGGLGAGIGAFVLGGSAPAAPNAAVQIVSPREGRSVPAGHPVAIKADLVGGKLTNSTSSQDANAGHFHVYVDGRLMSMPATTSSHVKLTSGFHTITVEFTAANHQSFSPRIMDKVAVRAR